MNHRVTTLSGITRCLIAFLLVACSLPVEFGFGQDDEAGTESEEVVESVQDSSTWTLPLPLRDRGGRPLRPIGFYLSQIVELVPAEFRAVSIDELRKAIGNETDRMSEGDQPRLLSGLYDIRLDDQLLVSERSKLVIEHQPRQVTRRKLGRVNLAISDSLGGLRAPLASGMSNTPRLEIDHEGELIAVVPNSATSPQSTPSGDDVSTDVDRSESAADESDAQAWRQSEIRFGWTLRSQSPGAIKKFELRLPRTAQTRLIISIPSDMELDSSQGVLVERPGPPPDADVQTRTGDIRWYVLEAGGLNRLELFAKRRSDGDDDQPLFVRRESKQYEVDLSGVSWIHRMTLQFTQQRKRLRLRSPRGTVTEVRVNSVEAKYQVIRQRDDRSVIDIHMPNNVPGRGEAPTAGTVGATQVPQSAVELVTLTIEGTSDWDLSDGFCELPSVVPDESNVLWTEASTQAIVTVLEPLEVVQWDLPANWRHSIQPPNRAGETLLIAEGTPPGAAPPDTAWSQLRLIEKPERFIEAVWTRLRVLQTPSTLIRSTSRIRCRLLQNHQSPFRMELNPDWTIDSVTIIGSGRRITAPVGGGELVIWPTPSESAQATFEIEVVAQQNLPRNRNRLAIGSTWIVQPEQHVASYVTSIQPPALRRWDGNAVMLPGRFEDSTLDEESAAFFQTTPETLLFRAATGQIPAVSLEPVESSFGVALRHIIETDGNDVSETVIVRAETTQPISELSVLTGHTRTEAFDWSLRRTDQSATVSLPTASVQRTPADPLGTYVISLEGRDLRQYELVGRRFFSAEDQLTLSLPSVRRTPSQTAEVLIDASWEVVSIPPGVQLVPGAEPNEPTETSAFASVQSQHLRYDPLARPEIQLRRARRDVAACLIWDQRFEVTANSRSEDLFHLVADVSSGKPIHIMYDDELEVVSVSRNGRKYDPDRTGIGELWIAPQRQSDQVAILMRRRHATSDWIRRCVIPHVEIEGHVVRSQAFYQTGPGTLLLHRGTLAQTFLSSGVDLKPEMILIPREVAIGLGSLTALVILFLAWSIAKLFTLGVHCLFVLVVVSISGAIIWWPWQSAILGWISVPLATAALLQVVMADRTARRGRSTPSSTSSSLDDTRSQRNVKDQSVDFSVSLPVSTLMLAIGLLLAWAGGLMAQDAPVDETGRDAESVPTKNSAWRDPIELLVPINEENVPVGDKVYMSQADYESIRSVVDPDRPVDAWFQSAEYQVVLTPPRDAAAAIGAEIQADYQIQLVRESTRVRLPVRADTLRRIELVSDGDTQIVRFTVNERGMVTATIPSSRQVVLRLTYVPSVLTIDSETDGETDSPAPADTAVASVGSVAEAGGTSGLAGGLAGGADSGKPPTTLVRLGIPAIHSAKLTVEAPQDIQVESLGNPQGRSLFRSELGRYEADLGPIKELMIRCRPSKRPGQSPQQTLRRAYRISAGIESTIVECEILPEEELDEGDTIQLTILGGAPPRLISSGWSMVPLESGDVADRPAVAATTVSNRIYRFEKQSAEKTPIHLLWRLPSELNDPTSTDDSTTMPIPEVFASASLRSTPTMFAIESDSSIRVAERAKGSRPASEEEFLEAWRGYSGKIQRAFVIRDAFPSFVLLQDKFPTSVVRLDHRLHVSNTNMELRLKAEIVDLQPSVRRVRVLLPDRFRVVSCLVNDEPIASLTPLKVRSSTGAEQWELALGDNRTGGTTTIDVIGQSMTPIRGQTPLPRFVISSDGETRETYRITRDRSLDVHLVQRAQELDRESEDEPDNGDARGEVDVRNWRKPDLTKADLLDGRIPVAVIDSSVGSAHGTEIVVGRRVNGSVFTCDQTTRMRYSDGQWFCDTLLELPVGKSPDYVDLQFPTRWATDLAVYPKSTWVKRESGDAAVTVIRVALPSQDAQLGGDASTSQRVQITGSLNNRDQVRVSVPTVSVLGGRLRNQTIAVPGQLTTQAIQWRVQSVRSLKSNKNLVESFYYQVESPERYSLYSPVERNWSIQLEPLLQATVNPVALSCDARVFLNDDHALVLQRFDLLPETRNEISVTLPTGATCIGIWSAGREVNLRELFSAEAEVPASEASAGGPMTVRVPLSYSRLPQSLEIMIKTPAVGRKIEDYLCHLVDVPTRDIWGVYYQTPLGDQGRQLHLKQQEESEPDSANELRQLELEKDFALAKSVVEAIESSRDMLAERSDEEIRRWLFPWITRYRSIANHSGHPFRIPAVSGQSPDAGDDSVLPADNRDRWRSYDARLMQLAGRFLPSDHNLSQPLFEPGRFADYETVAVTRLESLDDCPPLVQTFTQRKSLQELLVNAITMLTFGLAVILMWPFRGRFRGWIHEPSVWLFVVGFVALFLIPIPVAAMLMVVAVTVPLINRLKMRSPSAGV